MWRNRNGGRGHQQPQFVDVDDRGQKAPAAAPGLPPGVDAPESGVKRHEQRVHHVVPTEDEQSGAADPESAAAAAVLKRGGRTRRRRPGYNVVVAPVPNPLQRDGVVTAEPDYLGQSPGSQDPGMAQLTPPVEA